MPSRSFSPGAVGTRRRLASGRHVPRASRLGVGAAASPRRAGSRRTRRGRGRPRSPAAAAAHPDRTRSGRPGRHARRPHRSRRGRRAHRAARSGQRRHLEPWRGAGTPSPHCCWDGRSPRRGATLRAGSSERCWRGSRTSPRGRCSTSCGAGPESASRSVSRRWSWAGRTTPCCRERPRAGLADALGAEHTEIAGAAHWPIVAPSWRPTADAVHRWLVRRLGEPLLELYGEMMAERDAAGTTTSDAAGPRQATCRLRFGTSRRSTSSGASVGSLVSRRSRPSRTSLRVIRMP